MRLGRIHSLLLTLSLPSATSVYSYAGKHALNSTTYALLLDVPGTGNIAYKRTSVRPWFKPASLKRPAIQTGGDLLWANVPMPLYAGKNSTRTFKVRTMK